ncbi:arginase [Jannaschia sp. Os4]|uniref:arginase n=1 Tax=Jannaschia sp. Os4 TaxID=2807617 RepID=UPI0019396467|nr:arginase [Jannaschia sp. Os4]MBM2577554.1 arginase [Jannaschia sp. Os4]
MELDLIGLPVDAGAGRRGCALGAGALRVAGLEAALAGLGHAVTDRGDLRPLPSDAAHPNPAIHDLRECAGWIAAAHAQDFGDGVPVVLGGDHLMAAGSVPAMAARAARRGRPLHVLWLDAHSDFHDLASTESGNLHGTPAAYFTGQPGFDAFPALPAAVDGGDVTMLGLRSVDPAERARLRAAGVVVHDMRAIDEDGVRAPVAAALDRARAAGADLHVSFDVDFLDPAIAPAVGTTVPGGATFREAHLVMEMLCDSGLVTSLDVAELNPMLDERGRTATLLVDLVASLFGKTVLDRPT